MSRLESSAGIDWENEVLAELDQTSTTGYQPPRTAGIGRPLHEPVADLPRSTRRPARGLAIVSANRTGGATDGATIALALADLPRLSPRSSNGPSADDVLNSAPLGQLTEQVCLGVTSDTVFGLSAD